MKKLFLLSIPLLSLSSCTMRSNNHNYAYLNNNYYFRYCGDIHGADIYKEEVLDRYDGFTDYASLFDKGNSYLNFHCYGDSVDTFYCEGQIKIVNADGDVVLQNDSFRCHSNVGLYYGTIVFEKDEDKNQIGEIYVYAPYWCRVQLEYKSKDGGEKVLLTFEFWKGSFNPLPDFVND